MSGVALTKLDECMLEFFRTLSEVVEAATALRDLGARGAFLNGADHLRTVDEFTLTCAVRDVTLNAGVARTELKLALDILHKCVKK
jgi:hypothetical protein